MLKRRGIEKPAWYHCKWGKRFAQWLRDLAKTLDSMVAPVLESLVDRYELFRAEILRLDEAVRQLAKTNRYRAAHNELRKIPGIGLLTAMSFLTEMGDLHRFDNRRQVAAYLGACPSSFESGEANDRKGRITRQGPSRLRKLLCQASWVAQRYCLETKQTYKRIRGGKSNRTKKAIVAVMRRLGIKMWHRALSCGVSSELIGRPAERHRRVANGSPPTPALLLAGRQQTI
jgi:transposase